MNRDNYVWYAETLRGIEACSRHFVGRDALIGPSSWRGSPCGVYSLRDAGGIFLGSPLGELSAGDVEEVA
jgi:hypothetical protein